MTDNLTIERPINGDIPRYGNQGTVPQLSPEAFLSELDQLLAVPGVEAVRWEQYTPYFNDGDACEFGTYEPRVKLAERFGIGEDDGDYGDGYASIYDLNTYGPGGYTDKVYVLNGHDTSEIANTLRAFGRNMSHYENVLRNNFGDPSEVTATADGFSVEYYDHD